MVNEECYQNSLMVNVGKESLHLKEQLRRYVTRDITVQYGKVVNGAEMCGGENAGEKSISDVYLREAPILTMVLARKVNLENSINLRNEAAFN